MKKYAVLFICCLVVFSAATVHAQQGFTGPTLTQSQAVMVSQPITVIEAKNLPHDSWVVLTGNIVNIS
ncbi:MAG: hypothetical protein LBQ93_05895 [Treponema sp.]|jgi:uncharacterized protein YdeI (BOF family)|nr:hypothetical protein [Treponema sp.]